MAEWFYALEADQIFREVKQRAVRLVHDTPSGHPSTWTVIGPIAPMIVCTAQPLLEWVRRDEVDRVMHDGVSVDERERMQVRERQCPCPAR